MLRVPLPCGLGPPGWVAGGLKAAKKAALTLTPQNEGPLLPSSPLCLSSNLRRTVIQGMRGHGPDAAGAAGGAASEAARS